MKLKSTLIPVMAACTLAGGHISAHESTSTMSLSEDVKITRTQHGVPHIQAKSLFGLGYGNAYAQAQDHACILADGYVRVKGERAKYLGPHKNGQDNFFVSLDLGYKIIDLHGRVEREYTNLSADTRALADGFAAGYNQYLQDVNSGKATLAPACSGQAWVKPISGVDVVASVLASAVQNSIGRLLVQILQANPGTGNEWLPTIAKQESKQSQPWLMASNTNYQPKQLTQGSNGWAMGHEVTENGRGLLLANPHFPFNGNLRFWANHASVEGDFSTMGASVVGVPGIVNIGFNQDLAWTHTYSSARHEVIYQLELNPANPLQYKFDGQWVDIEKQQVNVEVLTPMGVLTMKKDYFTTPIGYVLEDQQNFKWDSKNAYVVRDTNLNNLEGIDHWLAMNRASNLDEFIDTFKTLDGLAFNNTLVADKHGEVFYIDDSNVPDLPAVGEELLRSHPVISEVYKKTRLAVLPGTSSALVYQQEVPYERAPKLRRNDYVLNANNSYWLTNLKEKLRGYSPLYGHVDYKQTRRTRYNLNLMRFARGADGKFDRHELESIVTGTSASFELYKPTVMATCALYAGQTIAVTETLSMPVDPTCKAFAKWDGKFNADSVSAPLAKEFFSLLEDEDLLIQFNSAFPAVTPSIVKAEKSTLVKLLAASKQLENAGFAIDAPLGELQYLQKGERRIPWPGAEHNSGGFNIYSTTNAMDLTSFAPQYAAPMKEVLNENWTISTGLSTDGYPINYGSSWMMVVGFDEHGPQARGLLTYSQSNNPNSPHFTDASDHYAAGKGLIDLPYTDAQIKQNKVSEITLSVKKD
ncbi:penicillin acylase family protein [Pseudoalteromonas luteoviolacea]|uniref:penicillin acylase family protein n=1 Tax=Pseudoalteromonas luteoviolacea TaxID=43657 RepID=UPI001B392619|nr:penicillin acylase family protein [Pseudoalteromonas luteoviolacea]MBQ4839281.1 penicillin acylase family protein [Pseudoalteromonas luteoviolacea]